MLLTSGHRVYSIIMRLGQQPCPRMLLPSRAPVNFTGRWTRPRCCAQGYAFPMSARSAARPLCRITGSSAKGSPRLLRRHVHHRSGKVLLGAQHGAGRGSPEGAERQAGQEAARSCTGAQRQLQRQGHQASAHPEGTYVWPPSRVLPLHVHGLLGQRSHCPINTPLDTTSTFQLRCLAHP